MNLVIEHIGGYCPVQAEGTVDGVPFYFRARHQRWQFAIGYDPVGVLLGWAEGFYRQAPLVHAGWISVEEAKIIIEACVHECHIISKLRELDTHTQNCPQCKKALSGRCAGTTIETILEQRCGQGKQIAREVLKENER